MMIANSPADSLPWKRVRAFMGGGVLMCDEGFFDGMPLAEAPVDRTDLAKRLSFPAKVRVGELMDGTIVVMAKPRDSERLVVARFAPNNFPECDAGELEREALREVESHRAAELAKNT